MLIERVKLTNFGPHKALDVDMTSGVFGIIGGNGSGKTNFLQAIKFAFTKDLDGRKKETYIRNFGQEDGANKGSVEVWWRKSGKQGHIVRTITPSGIKSVLTWDGDTFTKDADVAARMTEIMGVDKASLNNAVFTKQGELAELITGTPGDRTTIFFRLLNLAFLDSRVSDLAKKIDVLKEGVVDYGPALEETRSTITEYENQIAELQQGIDSIEDPAPLIQYIDAIGHDLQELAMTDRLIDNWTGQLRDSEARLNALLGVSKVGSLDELRQRIDNSTEKINRMAADLKRYDEDIAAYNDWRKWTSSKQSDAADLSKVNTQLGEYPVSHTQLADEIVKLREDMQKAQYLEGIKIRLEASAGDLSNATVEMMRCQSVKDSQETQNTLKLLEAFKNQLVANQDLLRSAEHLVGLYNENGTPKFADGVCPTCGQTIAAISPERVAELQKQVNDAKARITQFETLIRNKSNDIENNVEKPLRDAINKMDVLTGVHNSVENQYHLLSEGAPAESHEVLLGRLKSKEREYELVSQLISTKDRLQIRLEEANRHLERFNGKAPDCPDIEDVTDFERAINEAKLVLKQDKDWYESMVQFQANIKTAQDAITRQNTKRGTQAQELAKTVDAAPESLSDIDLADTTVLRDKMQELTELDARLMSLKDQKASAEHAKGIKEKREKDILELIGKNSRKVELIRELGQARQLIMKTGMPTMYMEDIFRRMVSTVNQLLDQMQANFKVSSDQDNPLTFKFVRLDDSSGYEMSQDVLSGGQSIRLALALLISLQRLIIPDVGLLVLDEPSSHIDAEGVESMATMFRNLGTVWANSEIQLLVVDHNPALISAFGKSISLTDAK